MTTQRPRNTAKLNRQRQQAARLDRLGARHRGAVDLGIVR